MWILGFMKTLTLLDQGLPGDVSSQQSLEDFSNVQNMVAPDFGLIRLGILEIAIIGKGIFRCCRRIRSSTIAGMPWSLRTYNRVREPARRVPQKLASLRTVVPATRQIEHFRIPAE